MFYNTCLGDSRRRLLLALLASAACGPSGPGTSSGSGASTDATGAGGASTTSAGASTTAASTSSSTAVDPTTDRPDPTTDDSPPCWGQTRAAGLRCSFDLQPAPCDLWSQDCPAQYKCSPYSNDGNHTWDATKCVPIAPDPDAIGEPCTVEGSAVSGFDSCDLGALCWDVDPVTFKGTCVGFCTGSPDAPICPEDLTCVVFNQGVVDLCLALCDPLVQDCPGGELCTSIPPNPSAFLCVPDTSGDVGQTFGPCESVNQCDPGLMCLDHTVADECDPMALACCTPFCDTTAPDTCPGAMQDCLPWYAMGTAPPGLEHVGVCAVP